MITSALTPGQWVTVRGGGFAGWLIRFGTHAPVAHAYLFVGLQANGCDMIEAEPGLVRWGRSSDYRAKTSFVSKLQLTSGEASRIVYAAEGLVGKAEYNFLADFYLGMRDGLRLHVPRVLFRLVSTAKHIECAQLVDYCYMTAGLHLFADGRAPGAVSPADLYWLDYTR